MKPRTVILAPCHALVAYAGSLAYTLAPAPDEWSAKARTVQEPLWRVGGTDPEILDALMYDTHFGGNGFLSPLYGT